jgi:Mycobacterium 19 kDa lipoprotein antigen
MTPRVSRRNAKAITASLISVSGLLCVVGCSHRLTQEVSLTIDGKKQDVRGLVSCSSHADGDVIKIGDSPGGIYVHVAPQNSGVDEIELGNTTGKLLSARGAKVSLKPDGVYDITGETVTADKTDADAPKPFELKVKCPSLPR